PVRWPPGRARLATRPLPTGSSTSAKTIGMTDDACFAATAAFPPVTMTSTLSRTNSAAISAKRSLRPSAQRYWIATVRPSIQPSFVRTLPKTASPCAPAGGPRRAEVADSWEFCRPLRAPRKGPRRCWAAECDQQLPPSDGDCHTPLPCEVRKRNDTTPQARSLHVSMLEFARRDC